MAHNGNMFEYSAMQNVWSSNSDSRQSTESINLKPIPGTARAGALQELSLLFCQTFRWTAYFDKPKGVKLGISKIANYNSSLIQTPGNAGYFL